MTHEKALKLLAECVSHAASDFPVKAKEYWVALRMIQQKKSNWISVKDRLPEDDFVANNEMVTEKVLVLSGDRCI